MAIIGGIPYFQTNPCCTRTGEAQMNVFINDVIYSKIVAGMCCTMIFGNTYYASWWNNSRYSPLCFLVTNIKPRKTAQLCKCTSTMEHMGIVFDFPSLKKRLRHHSVLFFPEYLLDFESLKVDEDGTSCGKLLIGTNWPWFNRLMCSRIWIWSLGFKRRVIPNWLPFFELKPVRLGWLTEWWKRRKQPTCARCPMVSWLFLCVQYQSKPLRCFDIRRANWQESFSFDIASAESS